MSAFVADLRFALRMFRRNPGFTLAALITIALGIGANTLVFGVVDTVLFKSLPYPEADRLVYVWETRLPEVPRRPVAPANFVDLRDRTSVFQSIAWSRDTMLTLTGEGAPELLIGYQFSSNYLDVMGVRPALGRFFRRDEMRPGQNQVAILSDGLWKRRFQAHPAVVGRTITLNGSPYTVVGVMPSSFNHPTDVEIWTPIAVPPEAFQNRQRGFLRLVARLKPGVSVEEAQRAVAGLGERLKQEHPSTNASVGFTVVSLRDMNVGDVKTALLVLLGVVGFVLLAACANVASLLLARAADRQHEIGVRIALGAGRTRLIRQLLTETLLLSIVGGAAGFLLAAWGVDGLVALFPKTIANLDIPRVDSIPIDLRLFGFTLAVTVLTGLLFGLAPVRQLTGSRSSDALRSGSKGSADHGASNRVRTALVVAQVSLALVLLVGAGLLSRSFTAMNSRSLGFDTKNVLTLRMILPTQKYGTPESWRLYGQRVSTAVQAVPGVQRAGITSFLPLSGWSNSVVYRVAGRPRLGEGRDPMARFSLADSHYFQAMSIRLVRGRGFTDADAEGREPVAIVNETLARDEWGGRDPVGEYLEVDNADKTTERWRIVGVVADLKYEGPNAEPEREVFRPFAQAPMPMLGVAVKAGGDPAALADPVRKAIWSVDRDQPVSWVLTTASLASDTLAPNRVSALFVSLFALVALVLAGVGTYGLLASIVAGRTREVGVRVALGASRTEVVRLILSQTMRLVIVGSVVGLAGALALARLIQSLLFGVSPTDPFVLAGVTLTIIVTAIVASAVPAWRAASIDPAVALRSE